MTDSLSRAERDLQHRALLALMRTDAWRILDAELSRREEIELSNLVRGGMTHDQYARASGSAHTLRMVRALPATLADALSPSEEDDRE